jgi:type VI secretion system protein ImpF
MAELNPRDRIQPFLLDRLSDDQADQAKESRDKNVFSPRQLKAALLRDLAWLLNTPAPIDDEGITEFPHATTSVLNFGVRDLTGLTASGLAAPELERNIVKAIQMFEPRLAKNTVTVALVSQEESKGSGVNTVGLEIRGEIVANQLPDPLYIKTEVDLETGQFMLKDRPNG